MYSETDPGEEAVDSALRAGAEDFVCSLSRRKELSARLAVQIRNKHYRDALRRLRDERDVLRRDVRIDPLTGVLNRRSIEQVLAALYNGAEGFGVLFIDIDHFKRVNDEHGHAAGDAVLRAVAHLLHQGMRHGDAIGRWGGEEFVILAGSNIPEAVMTVAERHRTAVEALTFEGGSPERVTVSIGAAFHDVTWDESPEQLLARADAALYAAKRGGRNRTCAAAEPLRARTSRLSPVMPPPRTSNNAPAAEREVGWPKIRY